MKYLLILFFISILSKKILKKPKVDENPKYYSVEKHSIEVSEPKDKTRYNQINQQITKKNQLLNPLWKPEKKKWETLTRKEKKKALNDSVSKNIEDDFRSSYHPKESDSVSEKDEDDIRRSQHKKKSNSFSVGKNESPTLNDPKMNKKYDKLNGADTIFDSCKGNSCVNVEGYPKKTSKISLKNSSKKMRLLRRKNKRY